MSPTVLLVNDIGSAGGGQKVMLDVAHALASAGFQLHLACPPGPLAEDAKALGAEWHQFDYSERRLLTPGWRLPRAHAVAARLAEGRQLAVLAAKVGADIVHTGALVPHIDAGLAGGGLRARTVWHLNQLHPAYLFAGPLPDKVISVSAAALRPSTWRRALRHRSVVIANGIDTSRFRPPSTEERLRVREFLGLGTAFTVVTVARLEPLKGIDVLLKAAARSRIRPVVLVVGDSTGFAGGASYERSLRSLAAELGVDARFLGNRADVGELLWGADVFGLASRWDAAPLALLEASACGLPVVSSDVGGCPEMVDDGRTGVLLRPDDVAGFARAFDRMAEQPGVREALGAAGRRRVEESFASADFAARLLPHYFGLVAGRSLTRTRGRLTVSGSTGLR